MSAAATNVTDQPDIVRSCQREECRLESSAVRVRDTSFAGAVNLNDTHYCFFQPFNPIDVIII